MLSEEIKSKNWLKAFHNTSGKGFRSDNEYAKITLNYIQQLEKNQKELIEVLNKNIQLNCNECIVVIDDDDRRCEKCPINKDKQLLQKITGKEV